MPLLSKDAVKVGDGVKQLRCWLSPKVLNKSLPLMSGLGTQEGGFCTIANPKGEAERSRGEDAVMAERWWGVCRISVECGLGAFSLCGRKLL